ncbi:MAG: DUF2156 domain-containing protein [Lachnospiraceae bacterium]|nr:DUF2156 domain-containing protein [Lachnospiraceae bacterium]
MLNFKPITLEDKDLITPYLYKYGALSCQYSMTLFTGLSIKYGDEYAIEEDILFIHRSKLDEKNAGDKRVYLAPLCNKDKLKRGVDIILEDASNHKSKIVFNTVTEEFKSFLEKEYPERFAYEYSRDYSEYIYETEKLSILPGRPLAPKRNRVRAFYSAYEGHIDIQNITRDNIADVAAFQEYWIKDRLSEEYDEMLARENEAIKFYLAHYDELEFKGIVVYVKGTVVGYAAGAALSDDCMDEVIEKGRKDVTGIYQLLCNEFALICAKGYKYINREEDLGVEGLRRAKESYCPDIMLEKYVATEI